MIHSMTAYANGSGAQEGLSWSWELRSVNAKGLDLRLRVPDWITGLEQALRETLQKRLARGSVSLSLRLNGGTGEGRTEINPQGLEDTLAMLAAVQAAAAHSGLELAPSTAAEVLSLRGVTQAASAGPEPEALCKALVADFAPVLDSFVAMRAAEGAALAGILGGQLREIEELTASAAAITHARKDDMAAALARALVRVTEAQAGADPDRVAQELALLAVKADVTEELDRLTAHVAAARALIAEGGPVGRKLDFLSQEFNREANTLCSKSQHKDLTAAGLALKAAIDQMREQIQNVE